MILASTEEMEKFSSKATIYVILLYASQDTRAEEGKGES